MELNTTTEESLLSASSLPAEPIITSRSVAELIWRLHWHSDNLKHTEELFTPLNIWRDLDLCPAFLIRELPGKKPGDTLTYEIAPGELLPPYDQSLWRAFPRQTFGRGQMTPHLGRFYPQGLLQAFSDALNPFRCIGLSDTDLQTDLNHPLAGRTLDLAVTVAAVHKKRGETGGQCQDRFGQLTDGPGLQVRWQDRPTDFFADDAFQRSDEQPDASFYTNPRLVSHIDRQAQQTIGRLYGRLLRPGLRVLDLMSSWQSHLPASLQPIEVVGLGLNDAELRQNPQLTGHIVHDLNLDPTLPYADASFDAVICTVSVEYLTQPLAVFAEIKRLLKPDGLYAVTFSTRWFPPKVIKVWTELADFERTGLILEYFLRTGDFTDLETFSARGWPRPADDKYYPQVRFADPVYAVWGRRAG